MGKGGLSYLNKKKWHPGSVKNMKEVYKKEDELLKCVKRSVYQSKVNEINGEQENRMDKRMNWMLPDNTEQQQKPQSLLKDFGDYKTKLIQQKYGNDTEEFKQTQLKEQRKKSEFINKQLRNNRTIRSKIDKIKNDPLYHILKKKK